MKAGVSMSPAACLVVASMGRGMMGDAWRTMGAREWADMDSLPDYLAVDPDDAEELAADCVEDES